MERTARDTVTHASVCGLVGQQEDNWMVNDEDDDRGGPHSRTKRAFIADDGEIADAKEIDDIFGDWDFNKGT